MGTLDRNVTRRVFLTTAGISATVTALPSRPQAVEFTAAERNNIKLVADFCAAWTVPIDWDKLGSFLASDCKFRPTQTTPLVEGRNAIIMMLRSFAEKATSCQFEVLDSWARGPIVANDRVDRFELPDQNMEIPVAGVFYVIDGKIAEWSDYTF
jgi:limonene-1,2-epoxide hydrolase